MSYPPQGNGDSASYGNVVTVNSNTTLTSSNYIVLCNAISGGITINLPSASLYNRKIYNIKKIDSSGNTVTIYGNASETIDGNITRALNLQYESLTIICDGSNWHII